MTYDPTRHHRRSIRLKGYDYAKAGAYFISICAHDRACLFGEIVGGEIRLNEYSECVLRWWEDIPRHFAAVDTDAFVVMPNHIHGIIVITDPPVGAGFPRPDEPRPDTFHPDTFHPDSYHPDTHPADAGALTGAGSSAGTGMDTGTGAGEGAGTAPLRVPSVRRPTLGNVVAYFKYQSVKQINALRQTPGAPVWQRGYFEHVIRNEESMDRIRQYIVDNPARWASDSENPRAVAPERLDIWRT